MKTNNAIEAILSFVGPWVDKFDLVQPKEDPLYNAVRLVKGSRDIIISSDRHDHSIYIHMGAPAENEDTESWLFGEVLLGRRSMSLEDFASSSPRWNSESRMITKRLRRMINPDRGDKILKVLQSVKGPLQSLIDFVLTDA